MIFDYDDDDTVWTFLERTYYIQIKICTKQLNDTVIFSVKKGKINYYFEL